MKNADDQNPSIKSKLLFFQNVATSFYSWIQIHQTFFAFYKFLPLPFLKIEKRQRFFKTEHKTSANSL
jgi:hypothetical protein